MESLLLVEDGRPAAALTYVALSVVVGFGAAGRKHADRLVSALYHPWHSHLPGEDRRHL